MGKVQLTARAGKDTYETSLGIDAGKATFHPGITTIWARQRVEELMDKWRESDENGQAEIRSTGDCARDAVPAGDAVHVIG